MPEAKTPQDTFRSITPRYVLNKDVVLSPALTLQLDEALVKIHHHQQIYVDWGFSAVDPAGAGLILNFFGPPGTGKTLTAEAFAGSLQRKILAASIADLESRFMGETSKNIVRLFEAARAEEAVLFLDEADTLLGKRLSSVTQGIDNEVNSMRSTLLIELEKHEGVVIFATNFAKNYDSAFVSRISHHIAFALPGTEERRAIWSNMLVQGIPLEDTRDALLDRVAEHAEGLSGRDIRTCMRLALPKPLVAGGSGKLSADHLIAAIEQVKSPANNIRSSRHESPGSDLDMARKLLGTNKG